MKFTVRVPATSANLGPGFDSFGLALQLYNEVTIDTDAEPGVTWEGEGAGELLTDGSDMISRAIRHAIESAGSPVPEFALHGLNGIPLERGLGSSSAAAVAGTMLGMMLTGIEPDPQAVFDASAVFEGHPDNAAPATFGGFTVVTDGQANRFNPHADLRPVVLVPGDLRLPTTEARQALPVSISMKDAVFNLSHAGLVVAGMTWDPGLLKAGLRDRLHEDIRLGMVPEARRVLAMVRGVGIAACLSGAGPSLIAFEQDGNTVPDAGTSWRTLRIEPDLDGARIV
jgi:homoserine kinase